MLGEKLTPRQFALLYKVKLDEGQTLKFLKDKDRKQFIEDRDVIRIFEEVKETHRRRKVMDGEWTEEESKEKLKEELSKILNDLPSEKEAYQIRRDYDHLLTLFSNLTHPEKLYEKEYYFDEGLGESLKEHTDNIK